jgi:glucokinase
VEFILSGDIGGTNARLALFQAEGGVVRFSALKTYQSRDFAALEDVLSAFLADTGAKPVAAALGVAGVLRGNTVQMVNLPWKPDALVIAAKLGIPKVLFLNDLEAAAWGVPALGPESRVTLLNGDPDLDGNLCLISAGTGLGEAGMVRWGGVHLPFRSEGGHVNFGPTNALEIDLLNHLSKRFGTVSYERIVSGPGLHNIYLFLKETGRGEEPAWLAERFQAKPHTPGRVITDCGLSGESQLCSDAIDLFVSVYGSAAGNLALKTLATAGVWLGGGIAPRLLPRLQGPVFRDAFFNKGRLRSMMERIPVHVSTDDRLALLGAARAGLMR